jgi:hypothetical protein
MKRNQVNTYLVEETDTFDGDAYYSWVKHTRVSATSKLGAIRVYARNTGVGWRKSWDDGTTTRYDLQGACICAFVTFSE